ncbi:MAG: RICIN domain-containing protein, partial [Methylococcales bacterium]
MSAKNQFYLNKPLLLFCLSGVTGWVSAAQLVNASHSQCLQADNDADIFAAECTPALPTQEWTYNAQKQVVNSKGQCLTVYSKNSYIYLGKCKSKPSREWVYEVSSSRLKNMETHQCLTVRRGALNERVKVAACSNGDSQKWRYDTSPT